MKALLVLAAIIAAPIAAAAQHAGGSPAPSTVAPREASQFDFLIGQWQVEVRPAISSLAAKIHGVPKLIGTWKAWRAVDGFGIEDELRISDESGNPRTLAHAVRVYDAAARRWTTSTLDVYRAVFGTSTGEWAENQMTATLRGADKDGKPNMTRTRFSNITPTSFRFTQERSADDGRTWTETLRVQAKRTAPTAAR